MFVSLGSNCYVAMALRDSKSPRVVSPYRTMGSSPLGVAHILDGDTNPGYSTPWLFPLEKLDATAQGYMDDSFPELSMRYVLTKELVYQDRHSLKFPLCYRDTPEIRQQLGRQLHPFLTALWQSRWVKMIHQVRAARDAGLPVCFCWTEHWPDWDAANIAKYHDVPALRYYWIGRVVDSLSSWCERVGLDQWWLIGVTKPLDYIHPALIGPRIVTAQCDKFEMQLNKDRPQWISLLQSTTERMRADA